MISFRNVRFGYGGAAPVIEAGTADLGRGLVCRLRHVPTDEALDVIEQAHLTAYRLRSIRELSLGQRRRVLLAAAWIGAPQVFVLDEPLETMDRPMRRVIREWVRARVERGDTVLLATHEFEGFADLASAAVTVRDGSIKCWTGLPSGAARRAGLLDDIAAASRMGAGTECSREDSG